MRVAVSHASRHVMLKTTDGEILQPPVAPQPGRLADPLRVGYRLLAAGVVLALAAAPLVRMYVILSTTGANTPSNDYVLSIGLIAQVLRGSYDWHNFLRDSMIGDHLHAIPLLVRLAIIKLTDWNIYVELYVGLAIAAVKVGLLFDAFTCRTKRAWRWVLLPLLSALVFSASQVSSFGFGDATLPLQLHQLGLVFGIWALVRFPRTLRGAILASVGGIVAIFSGGDAVSLWPALFAGMLLLRFADLRHYAVLFLAAVLSLLPYIVYLVLPHRTVVTGSESPLNYRAMVALIGWPFAQNFSIAEATVVGSLGIALLILGLELLWGRAMVPLDSLGASLSLLCYSLVNVWVISFFRASETQGLAPWYATHSMLYWIGLIGLAYVISAGTQEGESGHLGVNRKQLAVRRWWPAILGIVLGGAYFHSNITYADKAMYLYSRAPVSASCLRHYRTAPTYCEQYLFQWGVGEPVLLQALGEPLERNHLSVFAPHQEWALQGDWILDSVRVHQVESHPAQWMRLSDPADWWDYPHLDLVLHPPSWISWTVSLPSNVTHAVLNSAATAESRIGETSRGQVYVYDGGVNSSRLLRTETIATPAKHEQAFSIPLTPYAGRTVTIRLGTLRGSAWPVTTRYRYPVIAVDSNADKPAEPQVQPSLIATTSRNASLNAGSRSIWSETGMQRMSPGPKNTWKLSGGAALVLARPLNLCLANYDDLYFRAAVPRTSSPKLLDIPLAGPPLARRARLLVALDIVARHRSHLHPEAPIPLFADGKLHAYTYDLKLLGLPTGPRLAGLELAPSYVPPDPSADRIQLESVRLIRKRGQGMCKS